MTDYAHSQSIGWAIVWHRYLCQPVEMLVEICHSMGSNDIPWSMSDESTGFETSIPANAINSSI
jgi:hypothetical protein